MESFEFDEEGTSQINAIEGSEHVVSADTVIFAIGQQPEIPDGYGLSIGKGNRIEIDSSTFETSREGVYAAGDAVSGTTSVIEAIASGRNGAMAIDRYLGGSGTIGEELAPVEPPDAWLGRDEKFACLPRRENPRVPAWERIKNFEKTVQGLDEESAIEESRRCLQCDLRLKITPVKFWGEY